MIIMLQAELILSEEAYTAIREKLMGNIRPAKYATVIMPLSALLEKEFLAIHIKNGTSHPSWSLVMLLSGCREHDHDIRRKGRNRRYVCSV